MMIIGAIIGDIMMTYTPIRIGIIMTRMHLE